MNKNIGDCEVTLIHGDYGQLVKAKFINIEVNPYGQDFTSYTIKFSEFIAIQKGDLLEIKQTFKEKIREKMNKNLEELEEMKKDYIDRDVPESGMDEKDAMNIGFFMEKILKVLKNFEERLKKVEAELGIYTEEEIKNIKTGGTDPD